MYVIALQKCELKRKIFEKGVVRSGPENERIIIWYVLGGKKSLQKRAGPAYTYSNGAWKQNSNID